MLSFQEALEYLYRANVYGIRPGLERIRELLRRLGQPQDRLKCVHIAGTNGKGSVSSFLAHIAAADDLRCGWYTSPYLEHFNERFRILDGREGLERYRHDPRSAELPDERFAELMTKLVKMIDGMLADGFEMPTVFEMETALAFEWFAAEHCDLVVLEVGLGGRLDSTNVISSSLCSVITALSYDHQDRLGDRLGQIAFEKAGIVKDRCPVILYNPFDAVADDSEAADALREVEAACRLHQAPLTVVGKQDLASIHLTPDEQEEMRASGLRQVFRFRDEAENCRYGIRLLGEYQLLNAALAVRAARLFASPAAIVEGLAKATWGGRLELLAEDPVVLIDGAHNIQGCQALARALEQLLPGEQVYFLTGMLADKEHEKMLAAVLQNAHYEVAKVLCTDPPVPRALGAEALCAEVRSLLLKSTPPAAKALQEEDLRWDKDYERAVRTAFNEARALGLPLVLFGSLYLIGNARPILRQLLTAPEQEA